MITKVTSQKPKTTMPPVAAAGGELAAEFSRLLDSLKVEVSQQRDDEIQAVEFPVETREPVHESKEQSSLSPELVSPVQIPLQPEPIKEKVVEEEVVSEERNPVTLEHRASVETRPEGTSSKEEDVLPKAEEFKEAPLLPATPALQNTASKEEKVIAPEEGEQSEEPAQVVTSELPTESSRPQAPKGEAAASGEKGEVERASTPTEGKKVAPAAVGQIPAEASDSGAKVAESEVETGEPVAPREVREPVAGKAPIQQVTPGVNAIATAVAASAPGDPKGVSPGVGGVKGPAIGGVEGVAKSSSSPGGPVGGAFMKSTGETAGQTTKGSKELSRNQSLRALEMVETALKEATRSKDGKSISFRLDPPQLGQVKVDVSLRDGALHARIVAESPEVNQMLRERGHELQGMLRGLGLNVDKVSVSITSDGQQLWSEQRSSQQQEKRDPEQEMLKELMFVETQKTRPVSSEQKRQEIPLDHWVA